MQKGFRCQVSGVRPIAVCREHLVFPEARYHKQVLGKLELTDRDMTSEVWRLPLQGSM